MDYCITKCINGYINIHSLCVQNSVITYNLFVLDSKKKKIETELSITQNEYENVCYATLLPGYFSMYIIIITVQNIHLLDHDLKMLRTKKHSYDICGIKLIYNVDLIHYFKIYQFITDVICFISQTNLCIVIKPKDLSILEYEFKHKHINNEFFNSILSNIIKYSTFRKNFVSKFEKAKKNRIETTLNIIGFNESLDDYYINPDTISFCELSNFLCTNNNYLNKIDNNINLASNLADSLILCCRNADSFPNKYNDNETSASRVKNLVVNKIKSLSNQNIDYDDEIARLSFERILFCSKINSLGIYGCIKHIKTKGWFSRNIESKLVHQLYHMYSFLSVVIQDDINYVNSEISEIKFDYSIKHHAQQYWHYCLILFDCGLYIVIDIESMCIAKLGNQPKSTIVCLDNDSLPNIVLYNSEKGFITCNEGNYQAPSNCKLLLAIHNIILFQTIEKKFITVFRK